MKKIALSLLLFFTSQISHAASSPHSMMIKIIKGFSGEQCHFLAEAISAKKGNPYLLLISESSCSDKQANSLISKKLILMTRSMKSLRSQTPFSMNGKTVQFDNILVPDFKFLKNSIYHTSRISHPGNNSPSNESTMGSSRCETFENCEDFPERGQSRVDEGEDFPERNNEDNPDSPSVLF